MSLEGEPGGPASSPLRRLLQGRSQGLAARSRGCSSGCRRIRWCEAHFNPNTITWSGWPDCFRTEGSSSGRSLSSHGSCAHGELRRRRHVGADCLGWRPLSFPCSVRSGQPRRLFGRLARRGVGGPVATGRPSMRGGTRLLKGPLPCTRGRGRVFRRAMDYFVLSYIIEMVQFLSLLGFFYFRQGRFRLGFLLFGWFPPHEIAHGSTPLDPS